MWISHNRYGKSMYNIASKILFSIIIQVREQITHHIFRCSKIKIIPSHILWIPSGCCLLILTHTSWIDYSLISTTFSSLISFFPQRLITIFTHQHDYQKKKNRGGVLFKIRCKHLMSWFKKLFNIITTAHMFEFSTPFGLPINSSHAMLCSTTTTLTMHPQPRLELIAKTTHVLS